MHENGCRSRIPVCSANKHSMDWRVCQTWKFAIVVLGLLIRQANVQFAMPMFPPPPQPPMFGMPSPMQMKMMQIQIPNHQKNPIPALPPPGMVANNLAIPIPMPMSLQVAVPAQMQPSFCAAKPRPPSCPPCPPCICFPTCTPAFYSYCSSCHQKCRCRDGKDAPIPLPPVAPMPVPGPAFPFPMPIPPPSIIVPVPPIMRQPNIRGLKRYKNPSSQSSERKHHCSDASSDSSDDSSSSSSSTDTEVYRKRLKKLHFKRSSPKKLHKLSRKRIQFTRRTMGDDVLKPVLSFVNRDGNIRVSKKLTEDDVQKLMHDSSESGNAMYDRTRRVDRSNIIQHVRVWTDVDKSNQTQLTVMSEDNEKDLNNDDFRDFRRSNKKVILRKVGNENMKAGRKELVFKPPNDKTISNLSLSFQVA